MEIAKQLGSLIEQATSDSHTQPPLQLYQKILDIINSRVDMPKHTLNAVSKRLSIRNTKVLFYCFDLLEYLSYRCELALYSQISTKEFLLKISGILMGEGLEPAVQTKVLQTIKCWEELFRPHEDLLPMYFQFYAGLLRKEFPIQKDYVSPHRPKDFKAQRPKPEQKRQQEQVKGRPAKEKVEPSKMQQKTFEQIREKIILSNEIIDNVNPAEGVKGNTLLLEMMQEIKACQKKINQTINENPNQKIMELALAANDDIYITYRRFKDLQKNRKPEPFILAELASDFAKDIDIKQQKKIEESFVKPKKSNGDDNAVKKQTLAKVEQKPKKAPVPVVDIFDLACQPKSVKPQKKADSIDLISLATQASQPQPQPQKQDPFDLLGGPAPQPSQVPSVLAQNTFSANLNFMNSNYLGTNSAQNVQPVIQPLSNNFQSGFQSGLNVNPGFQSNAFGNINLSSNNYATQNDLQKYDPRSVFERLTDLAADLKQNKQS